MQILIILVDSELFCFNCWFNWNVPRSLHWRVLFLLVETTHFFRLFLVSFVDIVHYRGDTLEVGLELYLRYLWSFIRAFALLLLSYWVLGQLRLLSLNVLSGTPSTSLHLVIASLRGDVL
jgi:hypothetical protein